MSSRLIGGGVAGNERLTTLVGAVLLVLLAVLGVTILRIRQLIWLHLFLGLALVGPVLLKLGSTGYRFARYYTRSLVYRQKGPPVLVLRLIAPVVVASTMVVFVSGVLLLADGSGGRGELLLLHKASFIVWLVFVALHVLGHVRRVAALSGDVATPGGAGRLIAVSGAVVGGVILAIVLVPQFAAWTAPGAFPHHHG